MGLDRLAKEQGRGRSGDKDKVSGQSTLWPPTFPHGGAAEAQHIHPTWRKESVRPEELSLQAHRFLEQ